MDYKLPKDNSLNIHVGEKIHSKRQLMNLTLNDLGRFFDISPQQVQKYEKGKSSVTAKGLWKLSKLFDVPIQYFFDDYVDPEDSFLEENCLQFNADPMTKKETVELVTLYYKLKNRQALLDFIKMVLENEKGR